MIKLSEVEVSWEPNWIEYWGFWISLGGAIASAALAIAAIFLSVKAHNFSKLKAATEERDKKRQVRSDFAHDFMLMLDRGTVHLFTANIALVADSDFVAILESLNARARLLGEPGAMGYMKIFKNAGTFMEGVPVEKRLTLAIFMTGLIKLSITNWVENPNELPSEGWIESWAESHLKYNASEPPSEG